MTRLNKSKVKKVKKIITDSYKEQERRDRIFQITFLLADVNFNSQREREESILSYAKCSLNLDEIGSLIAPLRPENLKELKHRQGASVGVY